MIFLDNKCTAFGQIIDPHTLQRLSLPWLLPVFKVKRLFLRQRIIIHISRISELMRYLL